MTFLTSTEGNGGILPTEYSALITKPLAEQALAFQPSLSTVMSGAPGAHEIILPSIESDVDAAWVAEGEEITPDDPDMGETKLTFAKVAGLTIVSREMANDSSPQAQEIVGNSITRSIIKQINRAFLGNLEAPAPKGLASVAAINKVNGNGASIVNLDSFAHAVSLAATSGHALTGWALNPTDAATIATLKDSSESNRRLVESVTTLEGLPVFLNPNVPLGTAWGLDGTSIYTGLREDVELAVSDQAFFTSDRVAIRATARIGFAFPDASAITNVKLYTDE